MFCKTRAKKKVGRNGFPVAKCLRCFWLCVCVRFIFRELLSSGGECGRRFAFLIDCAPAASGGDHFLGGGIIKWCHELASLGWTKLATLWNIVTVQVGVCSRTVQVRDYRLVASANWFARIWLQCLNQKAVGRVFKNNLSITDFKHELMNLSKVY